MRRFSLLLFTLLSLNPITLSAFLQDTTAVTRQDSVGIEPVDSTRFRFIPGMGTMYQRVDSTSLLHYSQFDWTDAKYVGDLLWKIPGFYLRDLGEVGKFNHYTAFGLDWQNIPLLLDGRPLNDPYSVALNLYDIPLEAIEQIEVIDATDALMYGGQGTGINLVTRQYNNNRPMTKLRYLQGPFEYGLTDGLFTQNVARGTNVMVGFQRHVSDGRFTNSAFDSWNVRSQVRYNYSDRLNIALSYLYTSSENGLHGGISKTSPSLFNEVTALVQDENAGENISRHDITLTGISRLFQDSASTTNFSVYYSKNERDFSDPDSISTNRKASFYGVVIKQNLSTKNFHMLVGFDVLDESTLDPSSIELGQRNHSALFGKFELHLPGSLLPSASFRAEKNTLSYGLSLSGQVGRFMTVRADYSLFELHFPIPATRRTLNFAANITLNSNAHFSFVGYNQLSFYPSSYVLLGNEQTGFFTNTVQHKLYGGSAAVTVRYWKLESILTGGLTVQNDDGDNNIPLPKWASTGEFAFRDKILNNVMELRSGVRFHYTSSHRGIDFLPRFQLYTEHTGPAIDQSFTLDVFAIAHLGDAYLTLSWENVFDKEYVLVARYPMPGRTFRFGFNWTFLD